MAFEAIAEYIDKIEELLSQGISPRKTADQLGIPEKWRTISRYKNEVFDFRRAAAEEWTHEKQSRHSKKFNEAKGRIIDNFVYLNKLKIKADSLLDFNVGDEYKKVDKYGTEIKGIVTPHALSEIYGRSAQIGTAAIRAEQELSGDDPESRKASALEELSDAQLRAIVEATESSPKKGSKS